MSELRRWVYHATEEAKIVSYSEAKELFEKGWARSPAAFLNLKEAGIDPENKIQVQQVGEAVEGVVKSLNGALNLDTMNSPQLRKHAKKHFGKEFKNNLKKTELLEKVKNLHIEKTDKVD